MRQHRKPPAHIVLGVSCEPVYLRVWLHNFTHHLRSFQWLLALPDGQPRACRGQWLTRPPPPPRTWCCRYIFLIRNVCFTLVLTFAAQPSGRNGHYCISFKLPSRVLFFGFIHLQISKAKRYWKLTHRCNAKDHVSSLFSFFFFFPSESYGATFYLLNFIESWALIYFIFFISYY